MTKRLEQGSFCWPRGVEPGATRISLAPEAFALLTDGIDMPAAQKKCFLQHSAAGLIWPGR